MLAKNDPPQMCRNVLKGDKKSRQRASYRAALSSQKAGLPFPKGHLFYLASLPRLLQPSTSILYYGWALAGAALESGVAGVGYGRKTTY